MKTKTIGLTLAFCFLAAGACFANPHIGTWRLNEPKSKLGHGMGKNSTVRYEWAFFRVKVTIDGIDAKGKPMHNEWIGNFDGQDYPVTGDPHSDARSYRKIDDRTMDFAIKKNGKITISGRIVVSADGKTRTVTTTGRTAKGKKFRNVAVYNKQ